jgi:indole-3-glycerol phosphate synthase
VSILDTIVAERRADADAARRVVPLDALLRQAADRTHHSLAAALAACAGACVVAETKKASPSAGLIRADYDAGAIAAGYVAAGAAGVSVLTEPRHFMGSEEDLRAVRAAVDVPVLRKDFVCDEYQVAEAAAWGADVVLLIVAALDRARLTALSQAAAGLGLDVLAEAHSEREVDRALDLPGAIVGVNSRDLRTMQTDLAVAERLAARIPAGRHAMAESGIRTRSDVERLAAAGYSGFLVGETLMRATDPGGMLRELLGAAGPARSEGAGTTRGGADR